MSSDSEKLIEAGQSDGDAEIAPVTRVSSVKFQVDKPVKPEKPRLSPLDIPLIAEKSIAGKSIARLPSQDRGWPAWQVLIAATIQISFVSGTGASMLTPSPQTDHLQQASI